MTARLTKSYRMLVKAVDDDQGLIEAYGSVFDYEDAGRDIVRRGAFKRTIQNSKSRVADGKAKFLIPMLWQHDEKQPIGGWYDLKENEQGLICKGQIVLATQLGRDAYELIKAQVVNEFSIGYDIPKGGANYDKSSGARNLTELRLWEISPVTFAMNDEALLVGVKSRKDKKMLKKTLQEHYNEEMAQDLLEDWQDVFLCSLTSSVIDAFRIGDQPEQDISEALDAFKELVLSKFVAQAIECNLSQYISDTGYSYSPADYTMQYGSESQPASSSGYMSSSVQRGAKAGRALSASKTQAVQNHVDSVKSMADLMKKNANALHKAMHGAANELADSLTPAQDDKPDDDDTNDKPEEQKPGKSAVVPPQPARNAQQSRPSPEDTARDEEAAAALLSLLHKK